MILVTGANGQLGTELRHLLDERNEEYVAVDVAEMDITDADKVDEVFAEVKPTLVYHCAAYTAVDAVYDPSSIRFSTSAEDRGTRCMKKALNNSGLFLPSAVQSYLDGRLNQMENRMASGAIMASRSLYAFNIPSAVCNDLVASL